MLESVFCCCTCGAGRSNESYESLPLHEGFSSLDLASIEQHDILLVRYDKSPINLTLVDAGLRMVTTRRTGTPLVCISY